MKDVRKVSLQENRNSLKIPSTIKSYRFELDKTHLLQQFRISKERAGFAI